MSVMPETMYTPGARIEVLRREIDRLDALLVMLLARRRACARRIARLKRECGLPPRDLRREAEIRERCLALAAACGAERELLMRVLDALFAQVLDHGEQKG